MKIPHLEAELTKSSEPDLSVVPLEHGAGAGRIEMTPEQLERAALRLTMRTRVGGRPETGRSDPGTDGALVAHAYLELKRKTSQDEVARDIIQRAAQAIQERGLERPRVDLTKLKMHPSIQLASGRYYDFIEPRTTPLQITDIAAGLSRICRYTGQLAIDEDDIYSVAQHSVLAAENIPEPEFRYEALLHDRFESVGNDMASPLKQLLLDYKEVEARCEGDTAHYYGLPTVGSPEVKAIDLVMLATEKRDLMAKNPDDVGTWSLIAGVTPLPFRVIPWRPAESRHRFLHLYNYLTMGTLPKDGDKFAQPHIHAPQWWVDLLSAEWGRDARFKPRPEGY